jgi:prepilin-type N-terminal cleavage/methylation domain-containing protein
MLGNERGFTILELLMGVMIIGVLATFLAPQFTGLLQTYRLSGATRVVWGDLHRARIMAIKEGRSMRVDFTPTSYDIVRVDTAETIFHRDLTMDYPGIAIAIQNSSITFGSTGTAGGGSKTVQVQSPAGAKSFTIVTTGRIGKIS